MNPKTKRELGYFLSNYFISNCARRREKARIWIDDPRNDRAAVRLLELESQIEISDAMWQKLKYFYTESTDQFRIAVVASMRSVEFRSHPEDFQEWLEDLYEILTIEAEAAAYTVAA